MPLLFIGSGIILILAALKGNPVALGTLVENDFVGPNNYGYWLTAIVVLGFLGYVQSLRNLSRLFIALVVVVLLLDNQGFFVQLQAFIDSSKTATPTATPKATGGTQ